MDKLETMLIFLRNIREYMKGINFTCYFKIYFIASKVVELSVNSVA